MSYGQFRPLIMGIAILVPLAPAAAQDGNSALEAGSTGNVRVIDDKIVVRPQAPIGQSGVRVNAAPRSPEARAKDEAIKIRVTGAVQPNRPPDVVQGETETIVEIRNVIATSGSKDSTACVEIGTIGNDSECRGKVGHGR